MRSLVKRIVLAGLFAVAPAATPARADVAIGNGQNVTFPTEAGAFLTGATVIATDLVNPDVGSNPNIGGNLADVVVREASGTLDFLYQFRNNVTGGGVSVDAMSVSNYTNIGASVGSLGGVPALLSGLFQTPTISPAGPTSASRGLTGDPITFSGFSVGSGQISNVFFVRTGATGFDQLGTALASSATSGTGSDVFINKFEPIAVAIPEPGPVTLAAVAGGLALAGARLRRKGFCRNAM